MKKQCLVMIVSIFFVVSLSNTAMAVNDTTGDNLVSGVDLAGASVQTFAPQDSSVPPEYVKLGIRMAPGSHLPGLIIWDFDVDNNTATGSGSIVTGILAGNCGGGPCKTPAGGGFDFFVIMALRDQEDASSTALCGNCTGSPLQCTTRGAPTSCNEGTCYELGVSCDIGDPDCYEVTTECTGCIGGGSYYPLDQPCGTTQEDCGMGLLKGEWYMSIGSGSTPYERGRSFLPVSWNGTNYTQWCFTLPWHHLVARAAEKGADFDYDYTKNNPPKFQVSVYYDVAFTDGDDLFTLPGLNLDVSDWLPDTARVADGDFNQYSTCIADLNGDGAVDAPDVTLLLNDYGRWQLDRPCPSCQY